MRQSASPDVRRHFDRYITRANAFVHCRGRFRHAKVIDYSAGGLRLEGTFGLIKTDPIQIELISGTRVAARVAWSFGAQTGIMFFDALPIDHPALIELFRRAGPHTGAHEIVGSLQERE